METIGQQELWSFLDSSRTAKVAKNATIRNGAGHQIGSFLELATKVAELQFRNRDHVLLFRGQSGDYRDLDKSTLKPTLFRAAENNLPGSDTLIERFEILERAEESLVQKYRAAGFLGLDRLERHRIVRWSVLQHYGVCATPLLDVTHSLRIAASFASHDAAGEAFIFVVGVPNLSGGITASAEAGLQTIRLSSVYPPAALRPHIQEGYLLGEYPEMAGYPQKALYRHYEIDFGRRLVAKFRFAPAAFWRNDSFPLVGKQALYPSEDEDTVFRLALRVKESVNSR